MSSGKHERWTTDTVVWTMPVVPEAYERYPLTDQEKEALRRYPAARIASVERAACRQALHRLIQPVHDISKLRHPTDGGKQSRSAVIAFLIREMDTRQAAFWQWSMDDWVEVLSVTQGRKPAYFTSRPALIDLAYLLCGFDRLYAIGRLDWLPMAYAIFGRELVDTQIQQLSGYLQGSGGFGYSSTRDAADRWQRVISTVMLTCRSPHFEGLTREHLMTIAEHVDNYTSTVMRNKCALALERMGIFEREDLPQRQQPDLHQQPEQGEISPVWYAWCLAWRDLAVGEFAPGRLNYLAHLLAAGRWLAKHHPEIVSPDQWTEELALTYRAALSEERIGQYAGPTAQQILKAKGAFGKPLGHRSIQARLIALRRFFSDLQKRPHSVQGEPARKLPLHFSPHISFTVPDATRRAIEDVEPRDIDLAIWRKLAGAAARLSETDLSRSHQYPLSLYRAVALLWITTARRPNELQRLRLDCVRREWDHEMLDEDGLPLERGEDMLASETGKTVCYLRIPTTKYGGEFWIWVPHYTADAIDDWKKDRGMANEALYDAKDRAFADLLFCHRGKPLGGQFLNEHLIPLLCRAAGNIPPVDAKGRFTGHRGRSTRITLLRRCGMDLDDLAEYAGHKNTATIRHYARTDPLQLHRKIAKADALSQVIEGLIDVQAASRGHPSVRWLLGYDADGLPQFCGLPAHQTCPHRMDCPHCGLFIGGEKARLLSESEHVQPIWTEIPMTPPQQLLCEGQKEAALRELERLKDIPPPVPPSAAFLSNPLGLGEQRLEELAKEGSADAFAQLLMVADALRESLRDDARQGKDGRNVVVKRFRERLAQVTSLVVQCQMTMSSPLHENHSDRQQTGGLSKEMLEELVERSSSFQQG
jgi:integrase